MLLSLLLLSSASLHCDYTYELLRSSRVVRTIARACESWILSLGYQDPDIPVYQCGIHFSKDIFCCGISFRSAGTDADAVSGSIVTVVSAQQGATFTDNNGRLRKQSALRGHAPGQAEDEAVGATNLKLDPLRPGQGGTVRRGPTQHLNGMVHFILPICDLQHHRLFRYRCIAKDSTTTVQSVPAVLDDTRYHLHPLLRRPVRAPCGQHRLRKSERVPLAVLLPDLWPYGQQLAYRRHRQRAAPSPFLLRQTETVLPPNFAEGHVQLSRGLRLLGPHRRHGLYSLSLVASPDRPAERARMSPHDF
jgi:hypothetical protein